MKDTKRSGRRKGKEKVDEAEWNIHDEINVEEEEIGDDFVDVEWNNSDENANKAIKHEIGALAKRKKKLGKKKLLKKKTLRKMRKPMKMRIFMKKKTLTKMRKTMKMIIQTTREM
ncbi:hypothetical protein CTI12_AA520550 [Artemisia annua]|uniref:Uncharacterized protein n=1 Tax=Artemisia annua TaxID=35608 RepID=A0A2U1L800_ARTAN|nr:hypothetical protein CTI12_AA520550 [Artemisia annua]